MRCDLHSAATAYSRSGFKAADGVLKPLLSLTP
jgi:hypothetical protein